MESAIIFGEWLRVNAYDNGRAWVYLNDNGEYTTEQMFDTFKGLGYLN